MFVGVNYPWGTARLTPRSLGDYRIPPSTGLSFSSSGTDVGVTGGQARDPSIYSNTQQNTRPYWITRLSADLAAYVQAGITVVRWFLFPNLLTYGLWGRDLMTTSNPTDTRNFDWHFIPPDLRNATRSDLQAIRLDFIEILRRFQQFGGRVKLMPVLLDGWQIINRTYEDRTAPDGGVNSVPLPSLNANIPGARRSIFVDPHTRALFLSRFLQPLLEWSVPFADSIYAWDIINEPEGMFAEQRRWPLNAQEANPLTDDHVRDFLTAAVALVNNVQERGRSLFRSTVGYLDFGSMAGWNDIRYHPSARQAGFSSATVGCTVDQFHYYGGLVNWSSAGRHLPGSMSDREVRRRFAVRLDSNTHEQIVRQISVLQAAPSRVSRGTRIPVIIGEIGTNTTHTTPPRQTDTRDPFPLPSPYHELQFLSSSGLRANLVQRIQIVNSLRYDGVLLWSADRQAPREEDTRAWMYELQEAEQQSRTAPRNWGLRLSPDVLAAIRAVTPRTT
jgi:hypothetical protein